MCTAWAEVIFVALIVISIFIVRRIRNPQSALTTIDRVALSLLGVAIASIPMLMASDTVYELLGWHIVDHLLPSPGIIAPDYVIHTNAVIIQFAVFLTVVITIPWILYQAWASIGPKPQASLLLASSILGYAGMAFAYFIVVPATTQFISGVSANNVAPLISDIEAHTNYVFRTMIVYFMAFEVPVLIVLLVHKGTVQVNSLTKNRSKILIASFIVAAILTPPDVFSQVIVGIPLYVMFEFGLAMSRRPTYPDVERLE